MGGWGLGLFQSDYDYDIVDELAASAGEGTLDLYLPQHPVKVRKALDGGILDQLVKKYMAVVNEEYDCMTSKMRASPKYTLVLLGALAMQLGCRLAPDLRFFIAANYRSVGLLRDALTQMEAALDTYKNGVPHDFDSMGLHDTATTGGPPMADRIFPDMLNTASPETGTDWAAMMRTVSTDLRAQNLGRVGSSKAPAKGFCGNCGRTHSAKGGGPLLRCKGCKREQYCGRECQTAHWKAHRAECVKDDKEFERHLFLYVGSQTRRDGSTVIYAMDRDASSGLGRPGDASGVESVVQRHGC